MYVQNDFATPVNVNASNTSKVKSFLEYFITRDNVHLFITFKHKGCRFCTFIKIKYISRTCLTFSDIGYGYDILWIS